MRMRQLFAASCALALGTQAQGALIDRSFDIRASDFSLSGNGFGQPLADPLVLNFRLVFDTNTTILPTQAGLTVNSFNLPYPVLYAYNHAVETLTIGTVPSLRGCGLPANSFCIFIRRAGSADPTIESVFQVSSTGTFFTRMVQFRTDGQAVPEPASWAMMIVGFALAGAAVRTSNFTIRSGTGRGTAGEARGGRVGSA